MQRQFFLDVIQPFYEEKNQDLSEIPTILSRACFEVSRAEKNKISRQNTLFEFDIKFPGFYFYVI